MRLEAARQSAGFQQIYPQILLIISVRTRARSSPRSRRTAAAGCFCRDWRENQGLEETDVLSEARRATRAETACYRRGTRRARTFVFKAARAYRAIHNRDRRLSACLGSTFSRARNFPRIWDMVTRARVMTHRA